MFGNKDFGSSVYYVQEWMVGGNVSVVSVTGDHKDTRMKPEEVGKTS